MRFLFSFKNKYRTNLSEQDVYECINQLVETKSRFLFVSIHQYFGAVSEGEFTVTRQKFDWWGMMSSRLKGRVFNDGGTIIHTRITIPWVIVTIFLFVTVTALFAILKADEMTVNGEIRQADFSLKAMMVLFVFPACMISLPSLFCRLS